MAQAKRDNNQVTTLLAVSNADGTTPVVLYADPTTHRLLVSATAGALDDLTDVTITSVAQGDILYYNGTAWVNLPAGTSGWFLKTQGAGANPVWAATSTTVPTQITVANEATDTSCFPLFVTAATGDLGPKSNAGLTFNSNTGALGATSFTGAGTGLTGTAASLTAGAVTNATLTTALTVNGGTLTLTANVANTSVLTIGAGAVSVSGSNTGDQTSVSGNAGSVTVADEASDTTCFIGFYTAASGSLPGKTNANMTFNALSGVATFASVVLTTADINGGTLDNASIGASTPSTIVGTTITANTGLVPDADDGAYLGQSGTAFSDLFLASGGVINFAAGNGTITHSTGLLTINVPVSLGTSNALTAGTIELGAASDTTISRVSAGVIAVEGVTILTVAGGTLTGNITLGENTSIDLDPAGSADGKYSGVCITGTAGAALSFGQLIYLAVADSRWELTDADALATAGNILIGMCVLAAAADGNATKILLMGQIRADAQFPALTIGAAVYVGETAGAIQVAIPTGADNVVRVVGFALTADEIYFNPSQDHQTTVA